MGTGKRTKYSEMEKSLITEYNDFIIGKSGGMTNYYFDRRAKYRKQELALTLIQYVSENYWDWRPQKLFDSLNMDILRKWKLDSLLREIEFPTELGKETDLYYIAKLIYPDQITLSNFSIYLRPFIRVREGKQKKLRKGFWKDNFTEKFCACLGYCIDNYHPFSSVEEMYAFFGTRKCLGFLREQKLDIECKKHFDSPVVPLHYLLSKNDRSDILFQSYRFEQVFDDTYSNRPKGGRKRIDNKVVPSFEQLKDSSELVQCSEYLDNCLEGEEEEKDADYKVS